LLFMRMAVSLGMIWDECTTIGDSICFHKENIKLSHSAVLTPVGCFELHQAKQVTCVHRIKVLILT
jgi:hypothetical protein